MILKPSFEPTLKQGFDYSSSICVVDTCEENINAEYFSFLLMKQYNYLKCLEHALLHITLHQNNKLGKVPENVTLKMHTI